MITPKIDIGSHSYFLHSYYLIAKGVYPTNLSPFKDPRLFFSTLLHLQEKYNPKL